MIGLIYRLKGLMLRAGRGRAGMRQIATVAFVRGSIMEQVPSA